MPILYRKPPKIKNMITRVISTLLLAVLMISCSNQAGNDNQDAGTKAGEEKATAGQAYGVADVSKEPDKYVGQQIKVEGMVTHICKHGGKRLHLSKSGSDEMIRVRTGKNMSPFEKELEGNTIQVTGLFEEERLDREYLNQLKKDEAGGEHHDHQEGEGGEDQGEQADVEQGQVSESYIRELEAKIENSEKGYISEYWLTAESLVRK